MVERHLLAREGFAGHISRGMRLGVDILQPTWRGRSSYLRFER